MRIRHPFIAVEGLDGVGKTSVARAVAEQIKGVYVHTPPPEFEPLRKRLDPVASPQTRMLFFLSAVSLASQQIAELLTQAPVVCDRYVASTIAYQGAMDPRLLDADWKLRLVQPDATFYLCTDEPTRRARLAARRGKATGHTDRLLEDASYSAAVDKLYRATPDIEVVHTTDHGIDQIAGEIVRRMTAQRR